MTGDHDHDDHHDHGHRDHDHGHGHHHDRGPKAILRYLRHAPRMWRSEINDAVLGIVAPVAGERVVDIGAGMGAGSVLAARAGADVVAIEPTPFMRLVLGLRRLARRDGRRISVVDAGVEQMPVEDSTVDAVWATNTMHHWVDADRAVAEIGRILVPGGRVVLVDEAFDDPAHPEFERMRRNHGDEDHHAFHTVDIGAMADRLRDAGLVDVDTSRSELVGRPVFAATARRPD